MQTLWYTSICVSKVAKAATITPIPNPILVRSKYHHKPMDKTAREIESCILLGKSTF